jgi:CRISPR-associated protein Cas1
VTVEDAYLHRDGEQVVVKVAREERLRLPIHTLGGIVCFGPVMVSPFLLQLAAENGVCVTFLSQHGRFMARVEGPVRGNVLLRREQYRRADDPLASAAIARSFVTAKMHNSRLVLQRALRDHGEEIERAAVSTVIERIARVASRLGTCQQLDQIRGHEGEVADLYFSVFDHLIVTQKESMRFQGRTRRPPLDAVNALLSFVYTLLVHDVRGALETVGLDPAVGFLHRDRPGRPSLALDLMEEFRPLLADRLVLSLINLQQVTSAGFRNTESGGWTMKEDTRKQVLIAWQKRKQEAVTHPWLGEKVPIGLLPYTQAILLARHLRGDYDAYPPFAWK